MGKEKTQQQTPTMDQGQVLHVHEGRTWVFSGIVIGREGVLETIRLFRVAQTPIKRHIKLQGGANPFDPAWEVYARETLRRENGRHIEGKRQLLMLWKQQKGLCPHCHQKITKLTGWHNHHKVQYCSNKTFM